mmetsp:Transcript_3430/g.5020  ORF Transcript_3430/g.5020 Transcript_3430/m.5020 type:complete len:266 (-) Transcript_3430:195-992(-)
MKVSLCFLVGATVSTTVNVDGFAPRTAFPSSRTRTTTTTTFSPSSTARFMILEKLFGAGGMNEAKIDYMALDYPGPEIGEAAREGKVLATSPRKDNLVVASFAGGCFWGVELAFQRVAGVEYTAVGYTQGEELEPTYGLVCSGATGHTEGLIVYYDPAVCKYESLLDTFFTFVDPTTVNGQGNDRGTQYRTGVYYHTPEQEEIAKARFAAEQEKLGSRKIASECKPGMPFWPAEKYHQQYLEKGGRFGSPQSAEKGSTDPIRCYG